MAPWWGMLHDWVVQHPSSWTHSPLSCTWPPTTSNQAVHTICGNNTHIVSSSWRWAQKCQKHVEHIISAIKHSVASSWFFFSTHMQRCTDNHTSSLYMPCLYDAPFWRSRVGRMDRRTLVYYVAVWTGLNIYGLSNSIEQNPWVNASWRSGHHKFPHHVYKPELYRSHCGSYCITLIQSQSSKSAS